ncbi:sulfatase-like hydrolase/transferase [Flavivirga amylovorans]|uniref:Sulfatase-like hydrolase/transferase n=1 Tax=Flavivirga amylovorans TaxID=870486 RepID=A0ABT8WXT2_9FLAO|nr:sulfatase-like hydrolase/transferase [Flavivirga amylovorans]MDO5986199.1 sulfatase-like hydrolase/transferase [Flavivirga amylovorans]
MKIKSLLYILLVVSVYASPSCFAQKDKANILIIVTDEHNFRTLGVYKELFLEQGKTELANPWGEVPGFSTPNLDRIGHEGAVLTSMYASTPSCAPCRSSMFTGNYPHTAGVPKNGFALSPDALTIAKVLNKSGYETGYCGKWHLQEGNPEPGWAPDADVHGFKHNRYMFNTGHWKKLEMEADGVTPKVGGKGRRAVQVSDEKTYTTDYLTDRTLEFIDENGDKPFAWVLSFPDPHTPDVVREPYGSMYKPEDVKVPATWTTTGMRDESYPYWIREKQRIPEDKTPQQYVKSVAAYHGAVKCIDDNIGRILAKLEEKNILDNTIIVFSSDHGDMLGEYGHENKGTPYEGSGRIPFVIRYPKKIKAGTIIHEAANATDWMDTLITLSGIDQKDYNASKNQGRDLTPLLTGTQKDWEDITFVRFQNWASAITDRYKLIYDTTAEPWLIDLEIDPEESTNYFNSKDHKEIVKQLSKKLLEYGKWTKDDIVLKPFIQERLEKAIKG